MVTLLAVVVRLVEDALRWLVLLCRSTKSLEAENLFLRRQLALYIERGVKPRRLDVATRVSLVVLSKLFDWRNALVVVQPATLIRWHRAGWKLLWRVKSRRGRPPIPKELRALIRRMATRTVCGARSGSPTNCCSSWAFASQHEPCASTCRNGLRGGRAATNVGQRF
jgi:putative transposase